MTQTIDKNSKPQACVNNHSIFIQTAIHLLELL